MPPGGSVVLRLRLTPHRRDDPLAEVDAVVDRRKTDADAFYNAIHPKSANEDERRIQRQALAGLLWTKQAYFFDVNDWLSGDDPSHPPLASRQHVRNDHWRHLNSLAVLLPAGKWEYP